MNGYNYLEAVTDDVREYVADNIDLDEYTRDELEEKLNQDLWVEDSVTGNGSGSYTFNIEEAKEYVVDNMGLLMEAMQEFGSTAEDLGLMMYAEKWEEADVTIRCYLLGEAIETVLDEVEDDLKEE